MTAANAEELAKLILAGFDTFFSEFQALTAGGQGRFERADWAGVHNAMATRQEIYKKKIRLLSAEARQRFANLPQRSLWHDTKAAFAELIAEHANGDIAETFFNSVYGFVFAHKELRDAYAFVFEAPQRLKPAPSAAIYTEYALQLSGEIVPRLGQILKAPNFAIPYTDIDRDIDKMVQLLANLFEAHIDKDNPAQPLNARIQMLDALFYRNKGAYIVGRIQLADRVIPLVFALLNNERGSIDCDAVLVSADEVSKLFSFARSYFMVASSQPGPYVDFLGSIIPHKELFELYNAIGFGKHGKTVFYRSAVTHTQQSSDCYTIAPGIKGMVMLVFTLPSYDYVFKVIKDRFTPPKDMTREEVKSKYKLVKRWDLAGRMADTQEFSNMVFDRRRFSEPLMAELEKEVPSLLQRRGNALVLQHVYVERRMTPLNLYLKHATDAQVVSAMDEYGQAIRQLAGANIFPGDMLLKNFGVTRHARVVFYDYDEIMPLTDCHFRRIPEAVTFEQEMASEPWYTVGSFDVFPEEFSLFFSGEPRARKAFVQLHGELFQCQYWQQLQQDLRRGKYQDVFPYTQQYRL